MTFEILDRIKQPIPDHLSVTPQTTPVVYFGAFDKASACTISINPSHCEFYGNTAILTGTKKRLLSRKELNRSDSEELSQEEAQQVLDYCNNYFRVNPYKAWFNKYDEFLKVLGLSYYNDSVVHLDLVQWATTPLWSNIGECSRKALLGADLPFLEYLLSKQFDIIFLNGSTVVREVQQKLGLELVSEKASFNTRNNRLVPFNLYHGHFNGARVIGWSTYLQSPRIPSYEDTQLIASSIKRALGLP